MALPTVTIPCYTTRQARARRCNMPATTITGRVKSVNNGNKTGGPSPKGKRNLLTGVLIGLVILLLLTVVILATPLKELFIAKNSAPEISLELMGEQLFEEGSYRFEIEAMVTGKPVPEVSFSRDDSAGEAGENRAWILLAPGEQYTLTAIAENSAGQASAELELKAENEAVESQKPDSSQEPDTSQKPDPAEKPDPAQKPDPAEKPDPAGKNNPPVIKEITIDKSVVLVEGKCQITAITSDPDGDSLTYEWTGDGSISGAKGNPMTWTAPGTKGDYTVKVTVQDGRGGTATMSKVITVYNLPSQLPKLKKTTTLVPVKGGESGWIIENESIITTATYAGDNNKNQMVRGFVSIDISELAGKTVGKAVLHMKLKPDKEFGNPSAIGGLRLVASRWGPRKLILDDYNCPGSVFYDAPIYDIYISSRPDSEGMDRLLAKELQSCIDDGLNRFQFRLLLTKDVSNNNNKPDGVQYEFEDISLYVEYY